MSPKAPNRDVERFVGRRLDELYVAVAVSAPRLFVDGVSWARVGLVARGAAAQEVPFCITTLRTILESGLSDEHYAAVEPALNAAEQALAARRTNLPCSFVKASPHAELAREYLQLLFTRDVGRVRRLVLEAVDGGMALDALYLDVFQAAQRELGRLWLVNRIRPADEHYCTAVTQQMLDVLQPRVFPPRQDRARIPARRMVATTVRGEPHELGARMVADFFEMAGWETLFLGGNMEVEGLVEAMIRRRARVVVLSVSQVRHLPTLADYIRAIRRDLKTRHTVVLVGGYPFDLAPELWRHVGADGTARSASDAVALGESLLERRLSER